MKSQKANLDTVNAAHVKVLLRKDLLTLKRNFGFVASFILLPIMMMFGFAKLQSYVEGNLAPEQHNFQQTRYTKKDHSETFLQSGMSKRPADQHFQGNLTLMGGCRRLGRRQIGVVAPKDHLLNLMPHISGPFYSKGLDLVPFDSIEDFHDAVTKNATQDFCFGFELTDVRPGIDEINITYMFPRDVASDTYEPLYDLTARTPNMRAWNSTFLYGTPQFMVYATDLLAMLLTGKRVNEIELAFIPMKTPEFKQLEPYAEVQLSVTFPFFYMCIFLLPLYYMVTKLSEEKESKAREGMKMMGLNDKTYFTAWFILMLGIISGMSGLLVASSSYGIFKDSNLYFVFLMSLLYGMTLYGFSFFISALMPSKKSSATLASLLHIISFYVAFAFRGPAWPTYIKLLLALIPNCALAFTVEHLFHCELQGKGLSLEFAYIEYNNFSFMHGLVMLSVDVCVWGLLGYYCDQVAPRDFGVAKPYNFLCQSRNKQEAQSTLGDEIQSPELVKKGNFEDMIGQPDQQALRVRGLKKTFADGKQAVVGTSMTMYQGQIFALLGHNGAGKTTTISILTGLLQPTEGQASVFGIDMFQNMDQVRQKLGVCPQHNILFDYLTVREHLEIYAAFKGLESDQIKAEVDKMIIEIELFEIQNQLAATLSGGQKRKLSVGIALIGDSKLILLDEPTSGMDTTTRRRFWEMLKQYKKDRIIILTTHYMDEADILGDRICILAEGAVQCCGSSLFLKNRFGIGYQLVIAKLSSGLSPHIDAYLKKYLPEASKLSEIQTELSYQIPQGSSRKFKSFFQQLDKDKDKLKINSYGVDITTLEEVFLRIGHGENYDNKLKQLKEQKLTEEDKRLNQYSVAEDNQRTFSTQVQALVRKKLLVMTRDRKSFFVDTLLPCILMVLGLYLTTVELLGENMPRRALVAKGFPQNQPLIYNKFNFNQSTEDVQDFIDRTMKSDMGTLWSELQPQDIYTHQSFFEQIAQIDDAIFNSREKHGPQYGQFFIQQADPYERFYSIACLVNATSSASAMSFAGYGLQAVLRDLTGTQIKVNWHEKPLPFSLKFQTYISAAQSVFAAILFAVAYMMVSDTLVQSIIKERQTNLKHQLMVSGATSLAYWTSQYLVDIVFHMIPAVVAKASIIAFEIDAPQCEVVFFYFALVNPVFIYAVSFLFDTDSKASVLVRVFYFVLGGLAPIAIQVLQVVNSRCLEIAIELEKWFKAAPVFNLNYGYVSIVNRRILALLRNKDEDHYKPLDTVIAGKSIQSLQKLWVICWVFVILAELGVFGAITQPIVRPIGKAINKLFSMLKRQKSVANQGGASESDLAMLNMINDADPQTEAKRIAKISESRLSLKVEQLSKQYNYDGAPAVDELTFGLEQGECFALLGVTGAGKTTTFKCLTGEEVADTGRLYLGGHDVRSNQGQRDSRQLIGYCPQFDAIYEGISVREHLEIYGVIKGVREDLLEILVMKQLIQMDLVQFAHVQAGKLSGGNKRKLQCSIAMIGNPPIVLLDEPSTGVDPQAKRFMWTIISNISTQSKKSTVVLTTHSMEEAEALCPKIGIMVEGKFRCFGSAQHLKNKYGMGYEIEIKISPVACDSEKEIKLDQLQATLKSLDALSLKPELSLTGLGSDLWRHIEATGKVSVSELTKWVHIQKKGADVLKELQTQFKEVALIESYSNQFKFKLSRDSHSIGFLFGLLEEWKAKFSIQEYSAAQTSLEQIFNVFAREAQIRKQIEVHQQTAQLDKKHN